jgi:hypothetical protein
VEWEKTLKVEKKAAKSRGEIVGKCPDDGDDKMVEKFGKYVEEESGKSKDEIVDKRPDDVAGKEDEVGKCIGGEDSESREEIDKREEGGGRKSLEEGDGKCVDREAGICVDEGDGCVEEIAGKCEDGKCVRSCLSIVSYRVKAPLKAKLTDVWHLYVPSMFCHILNKYTSQRVQTLYA